MKGQNDLAMFIFIIFLVIVTILWAIVRLNDGVKVFDVYETTSGSLSSQGGQNG